METNYRKRCIRQREKEKLLFYFNPFKTYLPTCFVECSDHSDAQELVLDLHNRFPDLKFSIIEYTIDFLCTSFSGVRSLNQLLRHYLFFPRQNKVKFYDEKPNRTYHIGKLLKLYERPIGGFHRGWTQEDLNVLRLEYALKGKELAGYDFRNPLNFVLNASFLSVMQSKLGLKRTKRGNNLLPQEHEAFKALMEEYIKAKSLNNDPFLWQALEDDKDLHDFKLLIIQKIKTFDEEWQKRGIVLTHTQGSPLH